ncbi:MAG TPA: DMT family transporter [Sphingobacteriaceae bacterium]
MKTFRTIKTSGQKRNQNTSGWINGFIGVVIFSGSLPATRVAVLDFDPIFLTVARATIAGLCAALVLLLFKQKSPSARDFYSLVIVSIGCVIGFPLLTALALRNMSSAHSIVFIGILPFCTAIFGVLLAGERPRYQFWLFAMLGSILVAGFAFSQSSEMLRNGDLLMVAAVILCGLGYAEGGRLSRTLGGWQVICWALVFSMPLMAIAMFYTFPVNFDGIRPQGWIGLGYVSVFSMLVGFIFWYKGLAQGGIAAVGQLQLLQPFFGLMLASTLLNEAVGWPIILVTLGVVVCVAYAKRFA